MIQKKEDKPVTFYREKVFPALAGGLWAVFLVMDLARWGDSTWVKFAAICLCALTAWTGARTADGRLVAVALTFTVCADVFLLVLNRTATDQVIGVGLFIVVQLLYAYRLYRLRGRTLCRLGLALRLGALLLGTGVLLCLPGADALPALSGFYFLNLCVNCAEAFARKADRPVGRFAWGLLLFIGCDICVGFWNLTGLVPQWLTEFARVGMWLFYLPSQALIVLSQDIQGGAP